MNKTFIANYEKKQLVSNWNEIIYYPATWLTPADEGKEFELGKDFELEFWEGTSWWPIKHLVDGKVKEGTKVRAVPIPAQAAKDGAEITINTLLNYLAEYGGEIVSSNSLSSEWIEQARASGRLYVDENSLGYVWEPKFKDGFPTTEKEVELFDKWFPINYPIPEDISTWEKLKARKRNQSGLFPAPAKEQDKEMVEAAKYLTAYTKWIQDNWIVGTTGYWRRQADHRDQRTDEALAQEYLLQTRKQ